MNNNLQCDRYLEPLVEGDKRKLTKDDKTGVVCRSTNNLMNVRKLHFV